MTQPATIVILTHAGRGENSGEKIPTVEMAVGRDGTTPGLYLCWVVKEGDGGLSGPRHFSLCRLSLSPTTRRQIDGACLPTERTSSERGLPHNCIKVKLDSGRMPRAPHRSRCGSGSGWERAVLQWTSRAQHRLRHQTMPRFFCYYEQPHFFL